MKRLARRLAALAAAALLAACVAAPPREAPPQGPQRPLLPEAASGFTPKPGWATQRFAVAAAHPLAAEAGAAMIRAGGSAVDAAVAVQLVLGLVEPQSSGIGGGSFLLHFDGRRVEAYDGRETAPAGADERLFLGADGKPMSFQDAVVGGRPVGVPGTLRMLELSHREHGRLPWASLFEPAIGLAEQGFPVSPRLHRLIAGNPQLRDDPEARTYFFGPDGQAPATGTLLKNPHYAATLKRIARDGADAFYRGEIARDIVAKVQGHARNPGRLSLPDLEGYRARKRDPLCHAHRAGGREWRICGFPPPGSGAIAIGQVLGLLAAQGAERIPLSDGLPGARWLHLFFEASRLAFADRAQFVADPDHVPAPGGDWSSLLDPLYLSQRARLMTDRPMADPPAGHPAGAPHAFGPGPEPLEHGTSHISIVDREGRALAMTTTIEHEFGSRQMVRGFLLNNQLTDFSFAPRDARGQPVANRVQPGKRPRSSMSPTLVFDAASGELALSAGSPGGAAIIPFTAKTLYAMLHWGQDAQRAIDLPNFAAAGRAALLERGRFPAATQEELRRNGTQVREQDLTSGVQAIQRTPGGWLGGADPRREGVVRGD